MPSSWAMRLNGADLIVDGKPVRYPDLGFAVGVLAAGTQFGNAEPLAKTLNTLMTSGSWEVTERFGNRKPTLAIQIAGDTPAGLNAGEVWLSKLMRAGALEWLPPGQSVWTVFDITRCTLGRSYDGDWDRDESRALQRTYDVPLEALPYARSRDLTVTPATPLGATVDVLVHDGTSVTNWRAWGDAQPDTPSVADGTAVHVNHYSENNRRVYLEYTQATSLADSPYIVVDWFAGVGIIELHVNGRDCVLVSTVATATKIRGFSVNRSYFRVPAGVTSTTQFRFTFSATYTPGGYSYLQAGIDQVRRVSNLPVTRQSLFAIVPGGSAPADGTLHIQAPANGGLLPITMVYTCPAGRPTPALMGYATTSATPTPDPQMLNGQRTVIDSSTLTLRIPDQLLPSRGLVALWAKGTCSGASARVAWTASPVAAISGYAPGSLPDGVQQYGNVPVKPNYSGGFIQFLTLLTLPVSEVGPLGAHEIVLERTAGPGSVAIDEVWAFAVDDQSALTVVGTGYSGSASETSHLWIEAPTAEEPAGRVLIGNSRERARTPLFALAQGTVHKFPPAGVTVLAVGGSGTPDLAHYKRWTHHAAENK